MLEQNFSPDYAAARAAFRDAATGAGARLQSLALDARGPEDQELTLDVAALGKPDAPRTLILSSGTHGVEGFFGSAVQLAYLRGRPEVPADLQVILIHAMNPYGFAWVRRVNEDNVDLNRNFLLEGQAFSGTDPGYRQLNDLLNPTTPPKGDAFLLRAVFNILRHGFSTLKNSVVQGQYDFPKGLFFGGQQPVQTQQLLAAQLPAWLEGSQRVVHLDFHTGMGKWGTYVLACSQAITDPRVPFLKAHFGDTKVEALDPSGVLYEIRGVLGAWLQQQAKHIPYHCLLAEFGTYPPLKVLHALREENRAHHWTEPDDPRRHRAKAALKEVFAPASPTWRRDTVQQGLNLIQQGVAACLAPMGDGV